MTLKRFQEDVPEVKTGYECGIKKGEAAFYAPKVEFDFEDVLGRDGIKGAVIAVPAAEALIAGGCSRDGPLVQPTAGTRTTTNMQPVSLRRDMVRQPF